METVFVSYSHADADFADRLVSDLYESDVPATYDKWLLRVGDSIIEKVAQNVANAGAVIVLLSPASVESNWVKKELSLAMTSEIGGRTIRVLPAVIANCDIPVMLADKLYADFRDDYYEGIRLLFEALAPELYVRELYARRQRTEVAARELGEVLSLNDVAALGKWFSANGHVLATLFGRLWTVSESIPNFSLGDVNADFVVINGQSSRYESSLIALGSPPLTGVERNDLLRESERLEALLRWCKSHEEAFRRRLALRIASSYGAEQIAPKSRHGSGTHLRVDSKLLCGRRTDYGRRENGLRKDIYERTGGGVDIISYDRVIEALQKTAHDR